MSRQHHIKRSDNPVRMRIDEELLEEVKRLHAEYMPDAYQENFLAYLVRQGVRAMHRERTDVAEMQRRLEALEARLNSGEHE